MKSTGPSSPVELRRSLGLPLLALYGLGTLVGGGFYALVGKVADESGIAAPISFLTAAMVAAFSALSFGELSARYPVSAGESNYVHQAFGRRWLSICVGWLVIATGIVSAAMLANAFVGFLQDVTVVPRFAGVALIVVVLGAVAIWGIRESAAVAVLAIAPASLAESRTPLAAVLRQSGYESTLAMSVISMLAGINGALVQIIMASRIVYGMARKEMAPSYFEAVATSTRTPVRATILIIGLVLVFALWLPLLALARLTSAIILIVFAMVNLSLIRIKRQAPPVAADIPTWPIWVPAIGFVLSLAFVAVQIWASLSSLAAQQ